MTTEIVPLCAPGMLPWALAGASRLARYSGNTLSTYTTSSRLLFGWCADHGLDRPRAQHLDLELCVRHLEQVQCVPRSVVHHLTTVFGYYRFVKSTE